MGFIDVENEVPEDIPKLSEGIKKPGSVSSLTLRRQNVIVENTGWKMSFLLFGFQKVCNEYGIDYQECLVLLYLRELGLTGLRLAVFGKRIDLGLYIEKGFLVEDYSHEGKRLYKLTSRSFKIISRIDEVLSDNSSYIGENRKTDVSVDVKVKKTLSGYFD